MDAVTRIEQALQAAVGRAETGPCPPKLAAAMRYAVFPRGGRIRPRLCLAVAGACGEDEPALTDAAAAAIELLHCASLVHDDLPCFDDADTRRGRPSLHRAFGQPLAVLAGDALIVLAFQTMLGAGRSPHRLIHLMRTVGESVGVPGGIVAGQAWECEAQVDVGQYQRAKTGSLFAAATIAGAAATGAADPGHWGLLGQALGEAYQVADDLRDAAGDPEELGKPVGRDLALGRPTAIGNRPIGDAMGRLEELVRTAIGSIPPCSGAADLRALIQLEAKRLLPKKLSQYAA